MFNCYIKYKSGKTDWHSGFIRIEKSDLGIDFFYNKTDSLFILASDVEKLMVNSYGIKSNKN